MVRPTALELQSSAEAKPPAHGGELLLSTNIGLVFASLIAKGSCKLELTSGATSDAAKQDLATTFSRGLLEAGDPLVLQVGRRESTAIAMPEVTTFADRHKGTGLVIVDGVDYHGEVTDRLRPLFSYLADLIERDPKERPMICAIGPQVNYPDYTSPDCVLRTPLQQFVSHIATPSYIINPEGTIAYNPVVSYSARLALAARNTQPPVSPASVDRPLYSEPPLGEL